MEPGGGCDLAVRLYALAAQVCALYVQADWVVRQAFPQTADGEYLDRHAQLRGVTRKEAMAAQGTVQFTAGDTVREDRVISAGTVCMTAGLIRFETSREAVLKTGEKTVQVPVRALEKGAAGNVPAGAILSMAVAPVGIVSCTNPEACSGGADQEDDEALRERVLETFRRMPNGANIAFYQQGALAFDQVAAAAVIPRPRGIGTVDVVVSTLSGLPDEALLKELEDYFQARREIAVEVKVRAAQTQTVDISIKVAPREGLEFSRASQEAEATVRGWFDGRLLGQDVLRAKLGDLLFHCSSVANYAILTPAADLPMREDVLPVLGRLTVEEME